MTAQIAYNSEVGKLSFFSQKLILAFKNHKKKSLNKENSKYCTFKKCNIRIKELEELQLSAYKAIRKRVIKFESDNRMQIEKFSNVKFVVSNTEFRSLAEFIISNKSTLIEVHKFIHKKLQEVYTSFYTMISSYNYIYLGERWVTVPISEKSRETNKIWKKHIQVTVDGNKIKFPIQMDDLKGIEFQTVVDLPVNNDFIEINTKTSKRIKKVVLLRI